MLASFARGAVRRFDAFVRRRQGIWEFTQDERCIFRLGWGRAPYSIYLADGTAVLRGDPLLELHLWNERLPPMPPGGPDVAWAVRFVRLWRHSLELLAAYWRQDAACVGVAALHGVFALPGGQGVTMQERTLRTLGFDVVRPPRTPWRIFADFWENLYNWAILWTYNPGSLQVRRLLRLERCHLWMPRGRLLEERGEGQG